MKNIKKNSKKEQRNSTHQSNTFIYEAFSILSRVLSASFCIETILCNNHSELKTKIKRRMNYEPNY